METKYAVRQGRISTKTKSSADAGLERIARVVGKNSSANVTLNAESARQTAEVTIACKQHMIVAKAEGFDQRQVVQAAMERAEKQAQRYQERRRTRKRKPLPVVSV
jgi:putative sigma-54 modulation protein